MIRFEHGPLPPARARLWALLLGAAAFAGLWGSLEAFPDTDTPDVAEETTWQAARRTFPYSWMLRRACGGDQNALRELLAFSQYTDAAGSLGHCVVLAEVEERVGADAMAQALESLPQPVAADARMLLEGGRVELAWLRSHG